MEALQAAHRKELKDLQARITQKKKQATKKTRKGVNDECDALERETKDRHAAELAALANPEANDAKQEENGIEHDEGERAGGEASGALADGVEHMSLANQDTSSRQEQQPQQSQQPQHQQQEQEQEQDPSFNTKKPNRARARLARRQAEQEALFHAAERESSSLPNLKAAEREKMLAHFAALHLSEKEIRADGHCLYSAVADQLNELQIPLYTSATPTSKPRLSFFGSKNNSNHHHEDDGADNNNNSSSSNSNNNNNNNNNGAPPPPYKQVRKAAASYISTHPDAFAPFLEEPLDSYVRKIRDTGEWGGQLELLALARTYGVGISVVQGDGRVEEIEPQDQDQDGETARNGTDTQPGAGQRRLPDGQERDRRIWLAYYRHGFGLGEHYNSLHRKNKVK